MFKKGLAAVAAALGLLAAPGAVVESAKPVPSEAPAPLRNTDARHTRYYVPKGVRKRNRSRLTRFCAAVFGTGTGVKPWSRNRFARRSVAAAFADGRGRAVEGFDTRRQPSAGWVVCGVAADGVPVLKKRTRRSIENTKRLRDFALMLQGRAVAARVLGGESDGLQGTRVTSEPPGAMGARVTIYKCWSQFPEAWAYAKCEGYEKASGADLCEGMIGTVGYVSPSDGKHYCVCERCGALSVPSEET